jgi:hypothetical protein
MAKRKRRNPPKWAVDLELLPTGALIWRAQQNSRVCREAISILKRRGHKSATRFLEGVERNFRQNTTKTRMDFWRHAPEPPAGHWLAEEPKGKCHDCGESTTRRFNGYYQCGRCAHAVDLHGGHKAWKEELRRRAKKKKRQQKSDKTPDKSTLVAVTSTSEKPTQQQAANAELMAVGQAAYQAVKNGPLAQAIAGLKSGGKTDVTIA